MRIRPETAATAVRTEIRAGCWLDCRLALWIEPQRLLVVSDLHWGYAASHQARGNLLPAWGDEELERRLDALLEDYAPAEMLWLGDVVHAAEGAGRAEAYLSRCTTPVTILAGNHDRRWRRDSTRTAVRGGYFFHHGDMSPTVPETCVEVLGHHHPAINWTDGAGGRVKLPALVATPRRLVLPAFSPWAAGADCLALGGPGAEVWAIAPRRIFVLPRNR